MLNGRQLSEPYVKHDRPDEMLVGDNLDVGAVPPGRVFLLGDNRDESGDSRDWINPATGSHIFLACPSITSNTASRSSARCSSG